MEYAILTLLVFLAVLSGVVVDSIRNLREDLNGRFSEIEDRIVHRNLEDGAKAEPKPRIRSMWGNHG